MRYDWNFGVYVGTAVSCTRQRLFQRLVLVIGNGRVASAILKLCLLVRLTANLCLVDILYGI